MWPTIPLTLDFEGRAAMILAGAMPGLFAFERMTVTALA